MYLDMWHLPVYKLSINSLKYLLIYKIRNIFGHVEERCPEVLLNFGKFSWWSYENDMPLFLFFSWTLVLSLILTWPSLIVLWPFNLTMVLYHNSSERIPVRIRSAILGYNFLYRFLAGCEDINSIKWLCKYDK